MIVMFVAVILLAMIMMISSMMDLRLFNINNDSGMKPWAQDQKEQRPPAVGQGAAWTFSG